MSGQEEFGCGRVRQFFFFLVFVFLSHSERNRFAAQTNNTDTKEKMDRKMTHAHPPLLFGKIKNECPISVLQKHEGTRMWLMMISVF